MQKKKENLKKIKNMETIEKSGLRNGKEKRREKDGSGN